jgi:DNA-binding NarL/FixJ family response regulator
MTSNMTTAAHARMARIGVLLADDHPVLRTGLRQVIETDPSLHVVGEASDGEATLERMEALRPDVAVVDLDMPKLDGLGVLREARARGLKSAVLVLTLHADEMMLLEAFDLGARGYLLKDSALTAIVEGIKTVAAGRQYVTPTIAPMLLGRRARAAALATRQPGLASLTPTERKILGLIANGQSSKDIADVLFIHYRTVENHRVNIAHKLGLHGHNAVLKFALEHKADL